MRAILREVRGQVGNTRKGPDMFQSKVAVNAKSARREKALSMFGTTVTMAAYWATGTVIYFIGVGLTHLGL